MKNLLVSLFVMTFVCMGCAYESIDLEEGPQTYRASLEKYSQPTKVFMSKGLEVDWSMGDRIAVFEGSDAAKAYQLLGAAAGNGVGEFSLTDGERQRRKATIMTKRINSIIPLQTNMTSSDQKSAGHPTT